MRILVIEDEAKTAAYLRKGLQENGFIVDVAENGVDGCFLALNYQYDVAIIDIMLPKRDGWSVLTEIRQHKPDLRVLFLTAFGDVDYKVKALECGADDYLVKPFSFSELLARIRTLLRRGTIQNSQIIIADLMIDVVKRKTSRGALRFNLTSKEFALLTFLAQRIGEIVSRTLIAESVWDINFDSDTNVVDVAIRRLRQKIDDPFDKKLIHTVRGMGYVLEER